MYNIVLTVRLTVAVYVNNLQFEYFSNEMRVCGLKILSVCCAAKLITHNISL